MYTFLRGINIYVSNFVLRSYQSYNTVNLSKLYTVCTFPKNDLRGLLPSEGSQYFGRVITNLLFHTSLYVQFLYGTIYLIVFVPVNWIITVHTFVYLHAKWLIKCKLITHIFQADDFPKADTQARQVHVINWQTKHPFIHNCISALYIIYVDKQVYITTMVGNSINKCYKY